MGVPESVPPCANPAPVSQGYWHRQCLGAGLITPGRNGNGRGPTTVLEPDFLKTLVPAVDLRLQNTVFEFLTCEDGMMAEPPSDKCEKAIKQYTALLLNIESGRLDECCEVLPAVTGCASTNIGDLVNELAALINTQDETACKQASSCAAAINENQGVVPLVPPVTLLPADGLAGLWNSAVGAQVVNDSGEQPATTTSPDQGEASAAPTSAGGRVAGADSPKGDVPTVEASTPENLPGEQSQWIVGVANPAALDKEAAKKEAPEETSREPEDFKRHFAVLANESAPESARRISENALLTALGGGYDPEVRLWIVKGLIGNIDIGYTPLLARHLESIRDEAVEFGNDDLAKEAVKLLKNLESTEEPAG